MDGARGALGVRPRHTDAVTARPTVWVLGDQLDRNRGALAERTSDDCRVLLIVSQSKIRSKRWHRQRLHLVLSAMAHFAAELEDEGFEVDFRHAPSLIEGVRQHIDEMEVSRVVVMEPMSWAGKEMLGRVDGTIEIDLEVVPNGQFLCHYEDFAEWASERANLKMEDFYRWQRTRLDVLMDEDGEPVGGAWNFDHQNRERPPKDARSWPEVAPFTLDEIDDRVIGELPEQCWGSPPAGWWPVTRTQALQRLDDFIDSGLATFGPHEDVMLANEWKLAHSVLSSSLNLGLLHPAEVVTAAEQAFWEKGLPINSVEGFIRQVIGWREYAWGVFWLWMPEYRNRNELGATLPLPPAFTAVGSTEMACVSNVITKVDEYGYAHHIERLMVLGNLALTSGIDPWEMTEWMWSSFVDGAEWVMLPNVIGMALYADGGMMSTKPYASGGAYINRMSDHCRRCRYNPTHRVGDDACPFTTLYWDFLARNESALSGNHRMARQLAAMRNLSDLGEVRQHAQVVLAALQSGDL